MNVATNVFDIEGDDEGNPLPAPPPAEDPVVAEDVKRAPPRRRGRPRGSRNRDSTVEQLVTNVATAPLRAQSPVVPDGEDAPKDPGSLWTRIYDECQRQGASIDDYRICVDRTHMNGIPIQRTPMVPEFSGSTITGDPHQNMTPGEQLVGYIIDVHHRNCAPATYVVRFMSRRTGKTIRQSSPLPLEAYTDIQRKRDEVASRDRAKQYGGYVPPPMQYPVPAAAPTSSMDPLTRHLLDTVLGQLNESRAEIAHLRGQPAPAPVQLPAAAPSVAPVVVDADEAFMRKLKMMREMSALLSPPQPVLTAEAIGVAVRQNIMQMIDAGLVAKGGTVAVATAPPPDSIEAILDSKEKEERLKVKLRRAFPGEFMSKEEAEAAKNVETGIPPANVVAGSKFLGEELKWRPFPTSEEGGITWKDWIGLTIAENPKRSQDMIGTAMKVFAGNDGVLAKIMDAAKNFIGTGGVVQSVAEAPAITAASGWAPLT